MADQNLIADLARAGLDPELLQRVVMELARASAEREAIEARRQNDRERQARRRHVTSREVTGRHATSQDIAADEAETSFSKFEESPPSPPKGGSVPQGTRPRKARNRALPTDWQPGERSDRVRAELGRSTEWMNSTATDMRVWAESKGEVRSDWDATHDGWMRREAKRECERPPDSRAPPRGPSPGRRSTNGPLSLLASLNGADHDPPGSFEDHRTLDHDPADGRSGRSLHEPDGGSPSGAWPESRFRLLRAG